MGYQVLKRGYLAIVEQLSSRVTVYLELIIREVGDLVFIESRALCDESDDRVGRLTHTRRHPPVDLELYDAHEQNTHYESQCPSLCILNYDNRTLVEIYYLEVTHIYIGSIT
ncbi:hypothetical protein JCM31271_23920 [Halorubrum trueperi]